MLISNHPRRGRPPVALVEIKEGISTSSETISFRDAKNYVFVHYGAMHIRANTMVKNEEATARLLKDIFVCRGCKAKLRAPSLKVSQGKVRCRRCGSKVLRPKRRK